MNRRTRRLTGGAAALGAGAILIGPITALAQSNDDPPASTAPADPAPDDPESPDGPREVDIAGRLAEVLQPLVDAGTITQAQLDAVVAAVQDAAPPWSGRGPGGPHGDRRGRPGHIVGRMSLETAAETIGITEDELLDAVRDGQTIAEVATANGVEPQTVIDTLVTEATERLDEAVADGRIDQEDADERRAEITERITTAVNEGIPAPRGPGEWHHRDDGDTLDEPDQPDQPDDTAETPATTEVPATTAGGS
jgi:hypothetical protein